MRAGQVLDGYLLAAALQRSDENSSRFLPRLTLGLDSIKRYYVSSMVLVFVAVRRSVVCLDRSLAVEYFELVGGWRAFLFCGLSRWPQCLLSLGDWDFFRLDLNRFRPFRTEIATRKASAIPSTSLTRMDNPLPFVEVALCLL